MRFRSTRPRLAAVALLTLAVLPISGPSGTAGPTPEQPGTQSVRIPLRDVARDRSAVREVHSEKPFDLVGLTWQGQAPDRIEVRVRTAEGWGPWTQLEAEDGGSEPMWTGRSNDAQVHASAQGQDITDQLQFIGIDPAAQVTPPRIAAPQSDIPPVVTRAQWGADESKMTWPVEPTTTKAAVVHHTAGTNNYTCDQSAELVRGIYQYHAVELGWGDIGYHALVDKCGTVFEGRTGGLAGNVIGGHVRGFNRHTFGISMMGNYDGLAPSAATVRSVANMAAWKLGTAGVPADRTTRLVSEAPEGSKFPPGAEVTLPTIFGHRDASYTACPGKRGYDRLGAIRSQAADAQRAGRP
ncbi:peptidoglycan recognition protein family protein [Saccharopolyspora mangrovi]|uniref:Peptidoglycan recognition protein n=1 Tax=Saccharopolyspora mangrovi TaxID=3082379 RepID=A0ABU6AD53_9PSEU|nr:peptidoglycan recognition protein [Saccharopolyspora sp. S2-29]MEB3369476.1 peptidoglycan recognition protein [Saccharopolyspora sp. S2-29]